jgi:hypothetical protein
MSKLFRVAVVGALVCVVCTSVPKANAGSTTSQSGTISSLSSIWDLLGSQFQSSIPVISCPSDLNNLQVVKIPTDNGFIWLIGGGFDLQGDATVTGYFSSPGGTITFPTNSPDPGTGGTNNSGSQTPEPTTVILVLSAFTCLALRFGVKTLQRR